MIITFSCVLLAITAGAVTRWLVAYGFIRFSLHQTRKKLHDDALGRLADVFREGSPSSLTFTSLTTTSPRTWTRSCPLFAMESAGIPESVYINAQSDFGMKLITLLIQQIERTLECVRGGGTTFRINIKYIEGEGNVVVEGGKTL
jgi:two-component sensor histidine kinase